MQCHITVVLSGSKSSHLTGVLVCTGWYSLDRSPPWTLTHHPPGKLRQRSLLPVGKLWNSASSHGPLHDPAAMAPRTAQRRGTIGEPVRLQSEVGSVGLVGPGSFSLGLFSWFCAGLGSFFSSTGLAIDASPSMQHIHAVKADKLTAPAVFTRLLAPCWSIKPPKATTASVRRHKRDDSVGCTNLTRPTVLRKTSQLAISTTGFVRRSAASSEPGVC